MNEALYNLIRLHYRTLQGYVSAGMESGKDPKNIYMNANENPYELPDLKGLNRYPEPQPPKLLEAYASLYKVKPGHIVMTRGADEAIVILTKLFCEPHRDSILIMPPTFGMYTADAKAMPAHVLEIPLIKNDKGFTMDVDNVIATAKNPENAVKMVFVCSPNNPTGNSFAREQIIELCKKLEGTAIVIVDETYIEFAEQESMTKDMKNLPNMIVLRTLSKSYALAGIRMGCLLSGDEEFIALVRAKCLDAYPLPRESIASALHIMDDKTLKTAHNNRKRLLKERDRIRKAFEESKLVNKVYPSDANFLLIDMEFARDFVAHCAKEHIILRDFSDKKLTEGCIRISPSLPEHNDLLLKLLKSFEQMVQKSSAA
jgi:histidinol-phosphate aminotransferase